MSLAARRPTSTSRSVQQAGSEERGATTGGRPSSPGFKRERLATGARHEAKSYLHSDRSEV